jgi:hypothetical protein
MAGVAQVTLGWNCTTMCNWAGSLGRGVLDAGIGAVKGAWHMAKGAATCAIPTDPRACMGFIKQTGEGFVHQVKAAAGFVYGMATDPSATWDKFCKGDCLHATASAVTTLAITIAGAVIGRGIRAGELSEAAVGREVFSVGPYRPSSTPLQNHHGVMDVWAAENVPGYGRRAADSPTIALSKSQHDATNAVYREWATEMTGRPVGGNVNWRQVSAREIQRLAYRMFERARVPDPAVAEYFRAFHQYIYGLTK